MLGAATNLSWFSIITEFCFSFHHNLRHLGRQASTQLIRNLSSIHWGSPILSGFGVIYWILCM